MPLFFLGEIIEKLANASVARPLGGGFVKAARLNLHQGRFLARVLGPERSREPGRMAHDKALHILPPQKWNMLTEPLAVRFAQPMTMSVLFFGHPSGPFAL